MVPLVILIGSTLGLQLDAVGLGETAITHCQPTVPCHSTTCLPPGERAYLTEAGAPRDSANPDIFDLLDGTWTGRGTLFGRPAEFRMRWTLVLDGRFARLEFENAFPAEDSGPPSRLIAAIAFYPLEGSAPRSGWWFDSRGQTVSLAITPRDSALHVEWEGADERGRTVYRVGRDGVVVVDSVFAESGFREFGRATYARSAAGAERSEGGLPATEDDVRSAFGSAAPEKDQPGPGESERTVEVKPEPPRRAR